ncbi:integral membrane protein [Sarocladium implicatum]|nr:integral membrane protein [Sarocladium implicatum]
MADQGLPPHVTPEYIAESRVPIIVGVVVSLTVLSTLFVIARIFTRARLTGSMFLDDYLVIIAAVSQWLCVGFATTAALNGNGRHFDAMLFTQPEKLEKALFYTLLNFPFGIVAFGLPKIAVVALLTRIMNPSRAHRYFLWGLSLFCMTVLIGCIPLLFGQCTPSYSQWDLNFPPEKKKCLAKNVLVNYAISSGALSAFTDLYLAVYPAVVLWGLKLNIKKKIALSVALGIGSISTVVAIYKCTRLPSLASADFTWDTADLVIWTVVEAAVIIIACCIPLLQPLIDFILGRRTMTSSQGYKNYGSSRDGSAHLRSREIELDQKGGSKSTSKARTDVSRIHGGDFDDEYMQTRIETGSQESILRENAEQDFKLPLQSNTGAMQQGRDKTSRGKDGVIMKTREVTVSYSKGEQTTDTSRTTWGAV